MCTLVFLIDLHEWCCKKPFSSVNHYQSPCKFPAQCYVSFFFLFKLRSSQMSCTCAAASTLLGVPGGCFETLSWCVCCHTCVARGSCHNFLTLRLSCVLSLKEPVIALYTVFWMMWEHLDMTRLVLGMIIDASFLTVFCNHWYLLLSPSFIYHRKEKLRSAIFKLLIKCIWQKTWCFGQR